MHPLEEVARDLAVRAERGLILRTDRLCVGVHRDGQRSALLKWHYFLWEFPDLWSDDVPEASSDGVPSHPKHRAMLRSLIDGPKKIAVLYKSLGLTSDQRLYDPPHNIKDLVAMGLIELTEDGYRLTPKGRKIAALVPEDNA